MNSSMKRAVETLEALGFQNRAGDYDRGRKMRLYVHPDHPDEQTIRLYERANDVTARAAERRGHQIVGLEGAAPKAGVNVKERIKAQQQREREDAQRRLEKEKRKQQKRNAHMSKQDVEAEALKRLSLAERKTLCAEEDNHRFYAGLMRPGNGQ